MVTTENGEFVMRCNECGDEAFGGTLDPKSLDDFRTFVREQRVKGWKARKVEEVWEHYCKDCKDNC